MPGLLDLPSSCTQETGCAGRALCFQVALRLRVLSRRRQRSMLCPERAHCEQHSTKLTWRERRDFPYNDIWTHSLGPVSRSILTTHCSRNRAFVRRSVSGIMSVAWSRRNKLTMITSGKHVSTAGGVRHCTIIRARVNHAAATTGMLLEISNAVTHAEEVVLAWHCEARSKKSMEKPPVTYLPISSSWRHHVF
jgi:hypothetical protein